MNHDVLRSGAPWRWFFTCALAAVITLGAARTSADFDADLAELTRHPHRLSGTPEGQQAAAYLERRLLEMGIAADQLFPLDMVVLQTRVKRCELVVDGKTIAMHPMQPNTIVPPVTSAEGVTAPSIYVGDGSLMAYGTRRAEEDGRGKVVVLDYDSFGNWELAFVLGADAVIFIGDEDDPAQTPLQPKTAGVPANLLRFYIKAADLRAAGVDLKRDHASVTLHSEIVWEKTIGRNLVARIPGTDPLFGDAKRAEAIVLAAAYDSFGAVPTLSPGARGAANVAALLEAAEGFVKQPPRRDVLVMLLDNQARMHQGAREVYAAMLMPLAASEERTLQHRNEQEFLRRLQAALHTGELAAFGSAETGSGAREAAPTLTSSETLELSRQLQLGAEHLRDDVSKVLQVSRLRARKVARDSAAFQELEQLLRANERAQMRWDDVRRALHQHELRLYAAIRAAIIAEAWDVPADIAANEDWRKRFERAIREYREADAEERQILLANAQGSLEQLRALRRRVESIFAVRVAELDGELIRDGQRAALRRAIWKAVDKTEVETTIALHAAYDFSGDAPTWGVVVGDWTDKMFERVRKPRPDGNQHGYYGPTLQAFDAARQGLEGLHMDTASLRDTTLSMQLSPRPFVSSGYVAGMHGRYHVTLMTAYDARLRDGHPVDSVSHLNVQALRSQAAEGTRVLANAANGDRLHRSAVFKPFATTKYPTWSNGRSSGDYVGEQVTGGLSENRPAVGAMIAQWPARAATGAVTTWDTFRDAMVLPHFQPIALEAVDANGRFRVLSLEDTVNKTVMTLGALYDERGLVRAISTRKQQSQDINAVMRVNLFAAAGYALQTQETYPLKPEQFKMLKANADAPYRDTRSLLGQVKGTAFWYVSDYYASDPVKLFQPLGPVALNLTADHRSASGDGYPPSMFVTPPHLTGATSQDLWGLNESRLAQLRLRGVTSADLEDLHGEAKRERELATSAEDQTPLAVREAALMRAGVLSHRVYAPLRQAMDDLVHAIVMLLLLAIPFAFALERLLVCSPTIYGRIAGFVVIFLITFALLYFTHPGFAIASTPIIIFLAFTIILLSSLVIYIVVRKFRTELKAMQGQAVGVHDVQVSQMGTMLAAVNMGMSTMRRRPMRTTLTAVTVVALTFTILCFASFSRTIGVREVPSGLKPETTAPGLLLRNLDYSEMKTGVLSMLQGIEGEGGLVAPQWWMARTTAEAAPFSVTNPAAVTAGNTGQYSVAVSAVMGLDVRELERWYELAAALGAPAIPEEVKGDGARREAFVREHAAGVARMLEGGGVFLPPIVQEMLSLSPGQPILLNGAPATFAGSYDTVAMQRLRHLDGQSVLPVDFTTSGIELQTAAAATASNETALIMAEDVEKDYVHLPADQVAITSAEMVQRGGGNLHLIAIYPGRAADGTELLAEEIGSKAAKVAVMPVWAAGREGVRRMLLTVLTEVSGGLALGVPLVLGGLIIFGTLLGSIQDREKEIYTFSALGLSPTHVGVLFFAEAAVYAVVGGMGGQLLAQFVALGAGWLSRAGYIDPANINYSSTNALFAIGVVMATVIVSAIYPAMRASRSANPGLARAWKMPPPMDDDLRVKFPFTVSAYDITGVVSFLAEHFRRHDDAGLGSFAADRVVVRKTDEGNLEMAANVALAPFDLGVTQQFTLTALPSEIEGVDEVAIHAHRNSGARGDWLRSNKTFLKDLRKQFLLWRTLSAEMIEGYRMETLVALGEAPVSPEPRGAPGGGDDGTGAAGADPRLARV